MDRLRKLLVLALGAAGVALLAACQEDLEGGAACPGLCPEHQLQVRDTTIHPVVLDTTIAGFPLFGFEEVVLVATRGDTLRTALVARYDTLAQQIGGSADSAARVITGVDTASLEVTVADVPLLGAGAHATFDLYDVDTTAVEPDTAAVRALIRPDRYLSSLAVERDSVTGTLRIPVPSAFVAQRVIAGGRIRLAVTLRDDISGMVRLVASGPTAAGPVLTYTAQAQADTQTIRMTTSSEVPEDRPELSGIRDYQAVLVQPPVPPGLLVVGGLPGRRTYLRFDIPRAILDSTTIVRASLVLTQVPNDAFSLADTTTLIPLIGLATKVLDPEPGKAVLLTSASLSLTPVRIPVAQGQTRRVEMALLLRNWSNAGESGPTQALILQAGNEGSLPGAALFYPLEAATPSLRPRLEISYVPTAGAGLP